MHTHCATAERNINIGGHDDDDDDLNDGDGDVLTLPYFPEI